MIQYQKKKNTMRIIKNAYDVIEKTTLFFKNEALTSL